MSKKPAGGSVLLIWGVSLFGLYRVAVGLRHTLIEERRYPGPANAARVLARAAELALDVAGGPWI